MATDNELVEAEAQSWYVARNIDLAGRDLGALPAEIEGRDGEVLILLAETTGDELSQYALKAYHALLTIPGLLRAKLPVDVELLPFSAGLVQIGIRPTWKGLRYPVSAPRYFDATWNVLDALSTAVLAEPAPAAAPQAA